MCNKVLFPMSHLSLWDQGKSLVSFVLSVLVHENCWNPVELFFHDHKTIHPFSNFFDWFKDSKLFQISNFPMESILMMNWNFPWCMSCRFCIFLELELVRLSRKLPNSSENVRVDIKDPCFCQWSSLKIILCDAEFAGTFPVIHDSSFIFTMKIKPTLHICFLQVLCRLCGS